MHRGSLGSLKTPRNLSFVEKNGPISPRNGKSLYQTERRVTLEPDEVRGHTFGASDEPKVLPLTKSR
jgi:hypothetical protein